MANHFSLLIALTIINLHLISSHPITTPPPPPHHHSSHAPPPPPHHSTTPPQPHHSTTTPRPKITATPPPPQQTSSIEQETLNTIIDSITSQPGFQLWANLLSNSPTTKNLLPITATLFIPSNTAISHLPTATSTAINFDPFLIPYHITPARLSFSHLHLFQTSSRIPTLLPSKSILVTNTSSHNFTLDNSRITHPDMYLTSAIAVHGVQHILDYALFGDDQDSQPPPRKQPFLPLDEVLGQIKSNSHTCFSPVFPLFFPCFALFF